MIIIGERINTSRKQIAEALEKKDSEFIQKEALKQVEAGAGMLDVNVGTRIATEIEDMEWIVKVIQAVVKVPLCIDSPNPQAVEVGVKLCEGKVLINSITGEKERAQAFLPLIKKYNSEVVALTMNEQGIPKTSEERVETAREIVNFLKKEGISSERIYFDVLVQPISTDAKNGIIILETVKKIKEFFPLAKTVLGLSNISFGLPKRRLINRTFLVMAMSSGLDAALIDPLDNKIMDMLKAANALIGKDEYCMNYIQTSRGKETFGD